MYTKIYNMLKEKCINDHWAKRYVKFCLACSNNNINSSEILVKHHILPKHKEMFPEYANFKNNMWNCAMLTPRQHLIAHYMLYKSSGLFRDALSVMRASNYNLKGDLIVSTLNSKLYESTMLRVTLEKRTMVIVKNHKGEIFFVKKSDPRLVSGELVGITAGRGVYTNKISGETKMLDVNDPAVLSGEYVGYTKNKTMFKHKDTGEQRHLNVNDPLVLSGEYVGINKGKPRDIDVRKAHSNMMKGKSNPMYGTSYKWINDGLKNKRHPKDLAIPEGWYAGMKTAI